MSEAFLALAAVESSFAQNFGGSTGAAAWMMASCDLGRSCGSNGVFMRSRCLDLNICDVGTVSEYLRVHALTPSQFDSAVGIKLNILASLRSGRVNFSAATGN